jgi:AraC family transcriptional regulator, regulatory protein of adaptative response / methylphosphotriester-DNA alkyltransferase methyltransferase
MVRHPELPVSRKAEIVALFRQVLDDHLNDFMAGKIDRMYEIKDIAAIVCLHPGHLSQVIKQETGHHACYFYEQRILEEAKKMLADPSISIKSVAYRLDYDVSNFTKFFKKFMAVTPSEYRKTLVKQ